MTNPALDALNRFVEIFKLHAGIKPEFLWEQSSFGQLENTILTTLQAQPSSGGGEVAEAVEMLKALKEDCEQKDMPEGYLAKWAVNFAKKYADTLIQAAAPKAQDEGEVVKKAIEKEAELFEQNEDRWDVGYARGLRQALAILNASAGR